VLNQYEPMLPYGFYNHFLDGHDTMEGEEWGTLLDGLPPKNRPLFTHILEHLSQVCVRDRIESEQGMRDLVQSWGQPLFRQSEQGLGVIETRHDSNTCVQTALCLHHESGLLRCMLECSIKLALAKLYCQVRARGRPSEKPKS